MHSYALRPRRPARRDHMLCAIYDALPEDILRSVAVMAIVSGRHRYALRSRKRIRCI